MARPPKVTDAEILDVACRSFLASGPNLPISAIASELGVSEAALFKRFGTKRELMMHACCPSEEPAFLALLADGPDAGVPVEGQMREIAHAMIGFFREVLPRMALFKAAGISPLEVLDRFDMPPPVRGQRALKQWFDRAVELGMLRARDTDSLAFVFMGALHGRTMLSALAAQQLPPFDIDAYAAEVVELLVQGIRAGEAA